MGVIITRDDIRAYAEVDYIINHMNEKYVEKVPKKVLNFFSELKDPNYEVKVNPYVPLQKQGLKRYTLEIIALLHLKYWCEDEERKQELYGIMTSNQEKLEEQMRDKYSVEKLFGKDSAKLINGISDLQKEDFSKPRVVQRCAQYTEQNRNMQYCVKEEKENATSTNLFLENNCKIRKSLIEKIKEKFFPIFKRSKEI